MLSNSVFRVWIRSAIGKLKNKPLLDLVGGVVEDYEFLWDQYYFSTATM
jgi:peroxin-16